MFFKHYLLLFLLILSLEIEQTLVWFFIVPHVAQWAGRESIATLFFMGCGLGNIALGCWVVGFIPIPARGTLAQPLLKDDHI